MLWYNPYYGKEKRQAKESWQVIIPVGHPNPPAQHEVDAAYILARHYQTTIEFLIPVDDYRRKSADIVMLGTIWEIKSPIGESKSTIRNQFRRASRQAKSIIIDGRRTRLKYDILEKEVFFQIRKRPYIKKVILIDANEKVIEIQT